MNEDIISERHKTIDKLLEQDYLLIHVDSRTEGVSLPPYLLEKPSVTLKLSRLFKGGIALEKERIVTNLLFGGQYFECIVPFSAIWGTTSCMGEYFIWPETVPPQVLSEILEHVKSGTPRADQEPQSRLAAQRKERPAHLKRVK